MDLDAFLKSAGVEKYEKILKYQSISLEKLLKMTDEDLKMAGVTLLGPRRKLTSAIARQRASKQLES